MSRAFPLTILSLAAALLTAAPGLADPLLTKMEIAAAAARLDACITKKNKSANPKPASCIGTIKGKCDDQITAGGEAAHATCSDNETAAWDMLLNKQWKLLADNMDEKRFAALKAVQKLWLSYRDAKCAFIKGDGTDMMAYMNAADCMMDETARRALELRDVE